MLGLSGASLDASRTAGQHQPLREVHGRGFGSFSYMQRKRYYPLGHETVTKEWLS